ncbi:hypothetical protein LJ725_25920 [Reyranella aquatilis]|uniref:Uncharacterized protein n=1 Tax=Reyranella aquatilis TaxID=2035356 RepID=A0ABS8L251_9HYPH|nr:hypothetical protein [Reyranella aquatilis]MCC8432428.1 hypothetical protein [Reyranella aquatilis]
MTLRPEYSLGHSAYNDFLFGPLGSDASGIDLTVLSALTRLDLDPWQEAARLAALPREEAVEALARHIARLPGHPWTAIEVVKMAARLIALLPKGAVAAIPQTREMREAARAAAAGTSWSSTSASTSASTRPRAGLSTWLAWAALAVALCVLILQFMPDGTLGSSDRRSPERPTRAA